MITTDLRKRFLSIGLITTLACVALSGCGDNAQNKASVDTSTPASVQTDAANTGTDAEETASSDEASAQIKEVSYPLQNASELSIWSNFCQPESTYTDYTQSPFHMGLQEKTGVNVKWEFPVQGTSASQSYNLMLTNDELPDMIWWTYTTSSSDVELLIEEGVVRDLTDLLPEYAPNYWKFLQENPYYDRAMKTDSGKYYGIGNFRETIWQSTYAGPVIRKDWLDELGLEIPENINDWDEVIRAFHDEYGATFCATLNRMNPGLASGFNAFGFYGIDYYLDANGNVQCAQVGEEWEDLITKLNEWYQDGLLDVDFSTIDDSGMRTKALNGEVGISVTAISQLSLWIADAEAENTGAEWIGIPYPVVNAGEKVHRIQSEDTLQVNSVVITTDCTDEELETALRWLDYGFTEEGILYWNYGTEGETYNMVDGTPVFTDLITNDPKGMSAALDKYCGTQWTCISIQATDMVKAKNASASVEAVNTWTSNTDYKDYFYPSGVFMTSEETNEYGTIATSLSTYAKEMELKFIVGDEPLENMEQFRQNLESMGLSRAIEIKQGAYERYLNR